MTIIADLLRPIGAFSINLLGGTMQAVDGGGGDIARRIILVNSDGFLCAKNSRICLCVCVCV
jgi:hypothetical protein